MEMDNPNLLADVVEKMQFIPTASQEPVYAIKKNGKLLIHTIAQWRRAAIVAYLLQDSGQHIYCNDTDYSVENLWKAFADGAELVEVDIVEKTGVAGEKS
jgi:hypothetical protein